MILLAFVPLLYPPIPPLVDLAGHMGRFKVAADVAGSPSCSNGSPFAGCRSATSASTCSSCPLAKLIGVELATKLVVMLIPPLTVAGMLWVAREVHNRLPPTVAFALPLAFGHPFMFGFVNFALSMALALAGVRAVAAARPAGQVAGCAPCCSCRSASSSSSPTPSAGERSACCASRPKRCASMTADWSWWKAVLRAAYHASRDGAAAAADAAVADRGRPAA